MITTLIPRHRFQTVLTGSLRRYRPSLSLIPLLILLPAVAFGQSPFDTGFTALQTVLTGIRAIAKSYAESPEKTLIVSPDNASRRELNTAIQQELKAHGAIATDEQSLRVLVQRQDMTGAERSWASRYEINDVVRYARGSKATGIGAGEYGRVVDINSAANLLTVERSAGELANYDPRRLTGVSVYREATREFSVGDRIQFTSPDKSLGVANRDLAVVESVVPDGRISARLSNGRQIEFDSKEYRHFDHGYAITSHSSQGLTAERVLVNADANVHPDLINSRFAYVAISRASHETQLYVADFHSLRDAVNRDVAKTSAIDLNNGCTRSPAGMSMDVQPFALFTPASLRSKGGRSPSPCTCYALHMDDCLKGHQGHGHIARMRRDAVLASAQNCVGTVVTGDRRAPRAWITLVALGEAGVAKVGAAGALQKIASSSRHVPQLSRRAREQRLGEKDAESAYDASTSKDVRALGVVVASDAMMAEPARFVAQTMSNQGVPAWEFRFSYIAESMRKEWTGAPHATDSPFVFDTARVHYGAPFTSASMNLGF